MVDDPHSTQPRRRTGRRIAIVLFVAVVLIGGWAWVWKFAAGQAQAAVEGWRVREAKAGRVYSCGAQSVGGFPFRIELGCRQASARAAQRRHGAGDQDAARRGGGAGLRAEYAGQPVHRPAQRRGRRARAVPCRQLDLRRVARHRHAARAAERLAHLRAADRRAHRGRKAREPHQRASRRLERPHRFRLRRRSSGGRSRLARQARLGAGLEPRRRAAGRCRS